MKKLVGLLAVCIILAPVGIVHAGEYTGKKIQAKLASEEIEGDFMTVWAKKFADEMKNWSDGKITIDVYPYGSLGDSRDINELAQMGVVDFVYSDYAWISSFVPQAQVLALHYLWPKERMPEVLAWVMKNGQFRGLLEQKFRDKGLVPLSVIYEGWQWVTSKKPIHTMSDLRGMKVRLMASKILVEDYKAYGAVPTPMSYGEVYSGLQTGLIDAQVNPLFADYSMKFYEVQDYFTQLWAEPFLGIPTVNQKFFDSLPKNAQEKMIQFWSSAIIPSAEWIDKRNEHDRKMIEKERPNVKFTELSPGEIAKFKGKAASVYPEFIKYGGDGSQEIFDALVKDIAAAKKALHIQ